MYIVYCDGDEFTPPTLHATQQHAIKNYIHLKHLLRDRSPCVKIGSVTVTELAQQQLDQFNQDHQTVQVTKISSIEEELQIREIT